MNANKYQTNHARMLQLIEQLNKADIAYYRDDNPIMPDRDYDFLMDELRGLEQDTGLTLSHSPTQKVSGEILEELTPVRHTRPMLSADKTKSVEDLAKFASKQPVMLSWKMDGLTLVLRYEHGTLVQAITRGREGIIGEDVTHTVRTFLNVPLTIPTKESFEVRGEGVVSWKNFEMLNSSLEEPYSHPRGLAAGSVRKLNAGEAAKRMLEFWAFELVSDYLEPDFKLGQQQFLERNGFSVVPYIYIDALHNEKTIRDAIASMEPEKFAYPVDGLIMEYDDIRYGKSLGATGHHENRLIALKWQDELFETRFRGVELATTRTGMVSITGLFDPVEIDGATVSRAYLHNLDIFDEFQFGVGDVISVYKANMIIPQIAENLTRSSKLEIPDTCPACGHGTQIQKVNDVEALYCTNPDCAAKKIKSFALFASRDAMNIDGLSEATLEKFIARGFIHDFGDIFEIGKHRDEIVEMDGFGEKSFENLMTSLDKAKETTLAKVIYSLGIANIGLANAKVICRHFDDDLEKIRHADKEEISSIDTIGPVIAGSLTDYFSNEDNNRKLDHLMSHLTVKKEEKTGEQIFRNMNFVITGSVEHFANRAQAKEFIESLGGKVTGSVTSKTNYLINNDTTSNSSKNKKAKELGIPILSEEDFLKMAQQ